jgi:hypothetical protein
MGSSSTAAAHRGSLPAAIARRRRPAAPIAAAAADSNNPTTPILPVLGGETPTTHLGPDDVAAPIPLSSDGAAMAAAAAVAETGRLLAAADDGSAAATAAAAAAAVMSTEGVLSELVQLPVDCTELLGLRGHRSYLLCDVTRAYDSLLSRAPDAPGGEADEPPGQGFSEAALAGRLEVLTLAKDAAVLAEGRVGGRAAPRWYGAPADSWSAAAAASEAEAEAQAADPSSHSFAVPVYLLPSALVLLCQVGRADVVADLAQQALRNWVIREHHKRDLLLALALSFCGAARDLFDAGETLRGCDALEEALALLRNSTPSSGGGGGFSPTAADSRRPGFPALAALVQHDRAPSPPLLAANQPPLLAPRLASEIEQALAGLQEPRVLDELRLLAFGDPRRARAVSALRTMLQHQGGSNTTITPDYARMAFGLMTSSEVCEAANWAGLASGVAAEVRRQGGRGGSAPGKAARRCLASAAGSWLFPGALASAAAAHLVVGFAAREPETVRVAAALAAAADVAAADSAAAAPLSSSSSSSTPFPPPVPAPASAESAVLRAVAAVLLGAVDDAMALLAAAQALPSAAATGASVAGALPWPSADAQLAAAAAAPPDPVLADPVTGEPMLLPAAPQACWRFVQSQAVVSGGQEGGDADGNTDDLLPGLCVFAELWLSRLGFAAFPDTLERPPAAALSGYFGAARVEALLERYAQEAAARGLQRAQQQQQAGGRGPLALAAAAAARYVGTSAEGVWSSVVRGRGRVEQQQQQQQQQPRAADAHDAHDAEDADAAAYLLSQKTQARARIPAALPPPPPPLPSPPQPLPSSSSSFLPADVGGSSRPSSPSAMTAAATANTNNNKNNSARFLASQQQQQRSGGIGGILPRAVAGAARAAADVLTGGAALALSAVSSTVGSKRGAAAAAAFKATPSSAAAAIGAGAVLLAALAAARSPMLGRGGAARPQQLQQQRVAAVAPSSSHRRPTSSPSLSPVSVRVLAGPDAGSIIELTPARAERSLRRFLDARAQALGPRLDASGLAAAAAEPLLSAVASQADRCEAEGTVIVASSAGSSALRVTRLQATAGGVVGEAASASGGGAVVNFKLVLCEDGAWRVAALKE